MLNLKDFIESENQENKDDVILEAHDDSSLMEMDDDGSDRQMHGHPIDPPNILVMRRKSIRQFPNNQRVALYYVDKINKYITVPYTAMQWGTSLPEDFDIEDEILEEDVIHHLKSIVDNKAAKAIKFKDGSSMKVDTQTAHAVLKVHGALNDENKKKVAEVAHRSRQHFTKVVDFAWKNLKFK